MTRAVELVISGRVQGVSFRWYAAREATRLGLAGWIRNEPDGSVRGHVEGDDDAVDALVSWSGRARRRRASRTWRSPRSSRRVRRRSTSPTEPLRWSRTSGGVAVTVHRSVVRSDHPPAFAGFGPARWFSLPLWCSEA